MGGAEGEECLSPADLAGTSAIVCGAGIDFWDLGPLGFDGSLEGSADAVVTAIFADRMALTLADGTEVQFAWVGPLLSDRFSVGDTVLATATYYMDTVVGETGRAMISHERGYEACMLPQSFAALAFSSHTQCVSVDDDDEGDCCVTDTTEVRALDVSLGSQTISLNQGETGELEGWSVHNLLLYESPGAECSNDFEGEYHFDPRCSACITVLGPGTGG